MFSFSCLYSHMPYSKIESSVALEYEGDIFPIVSLLHLQLFSIRPQTLYLNKFEALILCHPKCLFLIFLTHIFYILYDFIL